MPARSGVALVVAIDCDTRTGKSLDGRLDSLAWGSAMRWRQEVKYASLCSCFYESNDARLWMAKLLDPIPHGNQTTTAVEDAAPGGRCLPQTDATNLELFNR